MIKHTQKGILEGAFCRAWVGAEVEGSVVVVVVGKVHGLEGEITVSG